MKKQGKTRKSKKKRKRKKGKEKRIGKRQWRRKTSGEDKGKGNVAGLDEKKKEKTEKHASGIGDTFHFSLAFLLHHV